MLQNDASDTSFLFSAGTLVPISVGGGTTLALSISGDGTILGRYIYYTSTYFTDLNGSINWLTNTPGFLGGINDESQIIGTSYDGQSEFVYDLSTGTVTTISFPGAPSSFPGYSGTNLISINDEGAVLGTAGNVAFVYNGGTFTTLTLPAGCRPTDMNDNEQIVGNCTTIAGNTAVSQGFLDNSGTLTYLDYNGNSNKNGTLVEGINDSGEILGTFSDIPEPSALVQLATGLACLMGLWLCVSFAQKRKLHAPSSQRSADLFLRSAVLRPHRCAKSSDE